MPPEATTDRDAIVNWVHDALAQKQRSGICEILRGIAKGVGAYGVILWEADWGLPLEDPDARLFTAGHWFRGGKHFAAHDLFVHGSVTGKTVLGSKPSWTNDVETEGSKTKKAKAFYKEHEIQRCLCVKVQFADGGTGGVSLYRQPGEPLFVNDDAVQLEEYCRLLPSLHEALQHRVSFELIDNIKDILQQAERHHDDVDLGLKKVCDAIRAEFKLIEVSIFLEDPDRTPGLFALHATTCPEYCAEKVYELGKPGLTSWVATHKRDLRIWDVRYFNRPRDLARIRKAYPGVEWKDEEKIVAITRKLLGPEAELPPLSFLAEPILIGKGARGVLQCATVTEAPFYLTAREHSVLSVIASQIAQHWHSWLEHRTVVEENDAWRKLVDSLNKLNYSVNTELRKQSPDVLNVLRKGLDATKDLIPHGEIMDVRLHDRATDELYFALGSDDWPEKAKRTRFSASRRPPASAGSYVFQNAKMEVIPSVHRHPYYTEVFPGVQSMMIAPIRSQSRVYGLLDIRRKDAEPFPIFAQQIAELLANQFGLYCELIETVGSLRKTEADIERKAKENAQAFADWQHQIRGPINQAHGRVLDLIRFEHNGFENAPQSIKVLRGLVGKAKRASGTLRLFSEMAAGNQLRIRQMPVQASELVKLLIETCQDNRQLASRRRQLIFDVKVDSFSPLNDRSLKLDVELVEQAVNNVIDNAFKYSYSRTAIQVAGTPSQSHFGITVTNEGIVLPSEDLEKARTRGWRGDQAQGHVGEGSGIGLWVVDHIMKAHGGKLGLSPSSGFVTTVTLLFPWG